MESSLQISLADRLRVAGRAIRGVFKQPTPQDLLGVYAGLFPGGPGSPPPRGMAELIKSYADMPWLHAVVGKIASGVASAEWKVFVVRNGDGEVSGAAISSGLISAIASRSLRSSRRSAVSKRSKITPCRRSWTNPMRLFWASPRAG